MEEHLPIRKNIRLKNYDYSQEGYYFITICTINRQEILGKIKDETKIELTQLGIIVEKYTKELKEIYKNITIDEYVIMPNHIHFIIVINYKTNVTISKIIQQYKGKISKEIGYSIWQKLFYEHIIVTENEYLKIKEYIQNNIRNWNKDIYCQI